jgi:ParB family chromosome partitioning protein
LSQLVSEKNLAKLKGLGRGLDALLSAENGRPDDALQSLNVELLQPGRYQPRTQMDESSLDELAESIRQQGVMQPVLVRPVADGRYEIIAGERRWRAARRAGLSDIPAVVRKVPDESALAMALIENIQRENLNPVEEAAGIQRLIDEFSMTHEAAAQAVGRSRSAVSNLLRLLALPGRVQEFILGGRLDMGHGRALLALPPARQLEVAEVVAHKQLSVRETERLVGRLLKPERAAPSVHNKAPDIAALEEELSDKLGTTVLVTHSAKRGGGKLIIHYASLDQLDGVLAKLR